MIRYIRSLAIGTIRRVSSVLRHSDMSGRKRCGGGVPRLGGLGTPLVVSESGATKFIEVPIDTCPSCRGMGSDPTFGNDVPCYTCGGSGRMKVNG